MPLAHSKTARVILGSRWVFMALLLGSKDNLELLPRIRLPRPRSARRLVLLVVSFLLPALPVSLGLPVRRCRSRLEVVPPLGQLERPATTVLSQ